MRVVPVAAPSAAAQAVVRFAGPAGAPADLPEQMRAEVDARLARGAVVALPTLGLIAPRLLIVARPPEWDQPVAVRRRFGAIARGLAIERVVRVAVDLPVDAQPAHADLIVGGLAQGLYAFDRFQAEPAPRLERCELAVTGGVRAWREPLALAADLAERTAWCRDLVNLPAADLGPAEFAAAAQRLVRDTGLDLAVLDERACRKLGMGCLLAVGQASPRRPRLLVVRLPGRREGRPLALCGKGVCFDTGGLNLKPAAGMALMRKDMAGAATVLAAMAALARRGAAGPVTAYLPLVDNAVAGDAFRPGDVLTACDGTTVEVGNTDAEGRLILADAIATARREGAGRIVSVATLTGAALTALGRIHVPLMGSDDGLLAAIERAAAAAGERVWRLPLIAEHRQSVRGQTARLTNDPGPEAACITAGAFLAHFAGDLPFAHLDISPASWETKPHDLGPAGATGVLVATLARMAAR